MIWDCSFSVGGKWPLLVICLVCKTPKWGAQGATGEVDGVAPF